MQDLFIQRNDKIQTTCTQMNQPGQCTVIRSCWGKF